MAGIGSSRGRALATAVVVAAALTVGACGSGGSPTTASTNPGSGQLGGAPTTAASTTPSATPGTTKTSDGGGPTAPTYPDKASDYAVAFMKAVSAQDNTRIDALAEQSAVFQATGGHPRLASGWSTYSCSSVQPDNTVGCTVRNSSGDDARVTMKAAQLGHPTAVSDVQLDLTQYPSDALAYVGEMLTAKGNDNKQRVARLSTSTMFGKLTCYIAGQLNPLPTPIDSTYQKVTISGIGTDLGKQMEFKVLNNTGGKPNAVKDLLSLTCPA